jgi:hypothetical protein
LLNMPLLLILLFSSSAYAAPPILFMGAFFPVWLAAMLIALPITFLLIAVLIKINLAASLQPRGLVYFALYTLISALVWLFAFT